MSNESDGARVGQARLKNGREGYSPKLHENVVNPARFFGILKSVLSLKWAHDCTLMSLIYPFTFNYWDIQTFLNTEF